MIWSSILLSALVAVPGSAPQQPAALRVPAPPPDVALFVLDDMSTDDLVGLELPALESLARRGVRFERAYGLPVCHPARRSLLSGELWTHNNASNPCNPGNHEGPQIGDLPLPQLFLSAGFETAGFGKWHLGEHPLGEPWPTAPFAHGFRHWFAGVPANVELCGGRNYRRWVRMEEGLTSFEATYQTSAIVSTFHSFWSAQRGPRFAYVAFQSAHEPFHRPPPELLPPNYPPTPDPRSQYEAMIVSADMALGQMLADIDLARTYVVVLGDNGTPESLAPDPLKAKQTTFERGIHVPMVIAGPGVNPGVSRSVVHAVDVFATLQELYGLAPGLHPRDGISLVPILRNAAQRTRTHVFVQYRDELVAVSARFKLREKAGVQAFYDLEADPLEEHPLALDDPDFRHEIAQHRLWLEAGRR